MARYIPQGLKEGFYDAVYEISSAFPGSNHLAHAVLVGAVPFLTGKYTAERIPKLRKYSTAIGLACAGMAEVVWQGFLEPESRYDHPGDNVSDLKGMVATTGGAGLALLISKLIKSKNR